MPGLPLERGHRPAHLAGMTRHIHDGVKLLARKRLKPIRNVAINAYKPSPGCNRAREPPCGTGHVVARSAGMGGDGTAEKLGTAKNQEPHERAYPATETMTLSPDR